MLPSLLGDYRSVLPAEPESLPSSLAVRWRPQITASIQREKPIRFFAYSTQVPPKPHRAGADEPTVPEPIGIVCHSSDDIQQSTRNLDAAAFRPV